MPAIPIQIREKVPSGSSAGFEMTFREEAPPGVLGALMVPTLITWTLLTARRAVVNGRDTVVVAVPASTITIVLSGADLVYSEGSTRYLLIEAVYTSSLGAGLPYRNEVVIPIAALVEEAV